MDLEPLTEQPAVLKTKPEEYQPVPTVGVTTLQTTSSHALVVDTHYNGPRPNNYMILTVITLCCCMGWPALFCSIIAIIYSMQVDLAWEVGHQNGARTASKNAKNWAIAAIITGVCTAVAIGVFYGVLYGAGVALINSNAAAGSKTTTSYSSP